MTQKPAKIFGYTSSTMASQSVLKMFVYHTVLIISKILTCREQNNPGNDKKELITPNLDLFIQTPRSVTAGQRKDVDDDEPKPDVGDPGSHVRSTSAYLHSFGTD
jgi:hypothetical protein